MFTLRGRKLELTPEDIFKAVKNVDPEPFTGNRKYYVIINGRRYPIKQVISLATGLPRISFTAMDAYRILTNLGFEVKIIEGTE